MAHTRRHARCYGEGVCAHCNNGWMSALEVSVQPYLTPLLTGQRVELSREALRLIAKWTYKTAMVCDVINPVNGLRYFTDDERHALMRTLEPPPDQPKGTRPNPPRPGHEPKIKADPSKSKKRY